jgi:voltage-gated potassium channel
MRVRRDESVAYFLDQLEHLPDLSKEELADLSEKVRKFR